MALRTMHPGFRTLYYPPEHPVLATVPRMRFLALDGAGDPRVDAGFEAAVRTLYAVAYELKAELRLASLDLTVMPLEVLRWDPEVGYPGDDPERLRWSALVALPEEVGPELVAHAVRRSGAARSLPMLPRVRLEVLHEGRVAQVTHVGPRGTEELAAEKLHAFILEQGLVAVGRHHEVYLDDAHRTAPVRLRTVLRQPVREGEAGRRIGELTGRGAGSEPQDGRGPGGVAKVGQDGVGAEALELGEGDPAGRHE